MESVATRCVKSSDGAKIVVEEAGPSGAPALVLVHGIAQSRASFASLLSGPLARDLRVVAYDLRGHGDSDKPEPAEAYADGARLGEDLRAVIDGLGLVRPTVLGWSYGGVAIGEYLRRYGDDGLGAAIFVGAAVKLGRAAKGLLGPAMLANGRGLCDADPDVYRVTSRTFLAGCFARPVDDLAPLVAEMERVPVHARRALLTRSEDFAPELAASRLPFATIHGALDEVILPAMSEAIAAAHPGTQATLLPAVGHVPWVEAPAAFEAAVRAALAPT